MVLNEHFSGAALVPVSFAISTGTFGLLGVPMLILHASLEVYLWVAGAIVAASLVAAAVRMLRRSTPAEKSKGSLLAGSSLRGLWIPFLLLSTALAAVSRSRVPTSYYYFVTCSRAGRKVLLEWSLVEKSRAVDPNFVAFLPEQS